MMGQAMHIKLKQKFLETVLTSTACKMPYYVVLYSTGLLKM